MIVRELVNRISFKLDKSGLKEAKTAISALKKELQRVGKEGSKAVKDTQRAAQTAAKQTQNRLKAEAQAVKTSMMQKKQEEKAAIQAEKAQQREIERTTRTYYRKNAAIRNAFTAIRNFGIGLSVSVTAPLTLAARKALTLATEFRRMAVSFEVFTGSANSAKELLSGIEGLAAKTPLTVGPLSRVANLMLATGSAVKDVIPELKMLGDLSQGNSAVLERIALQYTQAQAKGKPAMQDLRILAEAGVPVIKEMAKTLGVSTEQIFKLSEQGKLRFADLKKSLQSLTAEGGLFNNMLERQANTLGGKWTRLVGEFQILLRQFGQDWELVLIPLVDKLIEVVNALQAMPKSMRMTIVGVGAFVAALGPLLTLIGQLGIAVFGLKLLLMDLNAALSVTGATSAVTGLTSKFGGLSVMMMKVGASAKGMWGAILGPLGALAPFIAGALPGLGLFAQTTSRQNRESAERFRAFRGLDPETGLARQGGATGLGFLKPANVNLNMNSTVQVPQGTPESQKQFLDTEYRKVVRDEFSNMMQEVSANTGGL